MPFIPHTPADIDAMLATLRAKSIEDLFDEIPKDLRSGQLKQVPPGVSEMDLMRLMSERAEQDSGVLCFLGAGAYEHHIPAAVWDIATRGEFMTSYTPYQAEASQGTLQLLYEYQTMMTQLTGMEVSNASLYDGASALAEAILMAVRSSKQSNRRVLVPRGLHRHYLQAAQALVSSQKIELVEMGFNSEQGTLDTDGLTAAAKEEFVALVIAQPNFFGALEEVDQLVNWAHARKALVIAVVNPTSLAVLTPPGEWGDQGADIVVGEGQPLGIPLASGGPYFGFMCCKQAIVRQMPGRIIGRTLDLDGKEGFALTLQAREQHIRRSKATSNICTNQGLAVTAATIYMSLLGAEGLARVATACHENTQLLLTELSKISGVAPYFNGPTFHEVVVRLPRAAKSVLTQLAKRKIMGGYDLGQVYPELENCILTCATETKTAADINAYVSALKEIVE